MSISSYAAMDFETYDEILDIVDQNIIASLLKMSGLFLMFIVISFVLRKINNDRMIIAICSILVIVLAQVWIKFNVYPPIVDQYAVWSSAEILANGNILDEAHQQYLKMCPHQIGMITCMKFIMDVCNSTNVMIWREFNVICLAMTLIGMSMIAKDISSKSEAASLTAIIFILFCPAIFYTSYVYGTTSSIAFVTWSIYGTIKFCKYDSKNYVILPIILLPIANLLYQSTYVADIAVILTLIFFDKCSVKKLAICILIIFLCIGLNVMSKHIFFETTNIEIKKGIPASAYIYMGITSNNFDGINMRLYKENDENTEKTSATAWNLIHQTLNEYATGERSIKFFIEKMQYQWTDPFFSAIIMTCYPTTPEFKNNNLQVSELFSDFMNGKLIRLLQELLISYLSLVYAMAIIAALYAMFKDINSSMKIIALYFIGGFIFQIFWETKARYCFSYFIYLIPLASCSINLIVEKIKEKIFLHKTLTI